MLIKDVRLLYQFYVDKHISKSILDLCLLNNNNHPRHRHHNHTHSPHHQNDCLQSGQVINVAM